MAAGFFRFAVGGTRIFMFGLGVRARESGPPAKLALSQLAPAGRRGGQGHFERRSRTRNPRSQHPPWRCRGGVATLSIQTELRRNQQTGAPWARSKGEGDVSATAKGRAQTSRNIYSTPLCWQFLLGGL